MEEAKLQTLEQIKTFLDETSEVAFRVPKEDCNPFIERGFQMGHFYIPEPLAKLTNQTGLTAEKR